MKDKSFFITTPIYYVNDIPHIGTSYTTIAADVLARFKRLFGYDVLFLTGTDEHGEKIQTAAEKKGKSPQAFTDEVAAVFKDTWTKLNISFDDFIRTTESRHEKVVTHYMKAAMSSGDVYLGEYEGWYCVSDETFWTEGQLVNSKCPSCSRDVKKVKEENYFFKVSRYIPKLLEHIEKNPDFILPESKRNEVLAFLKEGVRDVSVSRTNFTWGIPLPVDGSKDSKHVIYVWFDALLNYVSALAPLETNSKMQKFWGTPELPCAYHLIGKDILRFHAVYWPCFLMSVGLPLPKRIFAHGWWTIEGQKMSKSLGNAIEPLAFTAQYGQDAFRLFLFREFPMGQDGDFSLKNFKERVNADLANNLGNLVSRTTNLIDKNLGGEISPVKESAELEPILQNISIAVANIDERMGKFEFHDVLLKIFNILLSLNKYIDTKAPWAMAKDPSKKTELTEVLNNVAEGIRISSLLLNPFVPLTTQEILTRLGQLTAKELEGQNPSDFLKWGFGRKAKIKIGPPLFPRLT